MSRSRRAENAERIRAAGRRLATWLNSPRSKDHPAVSLITRTHNLLRFSQGPTDGDEFEIREEIEEYKRKIDGIAAKFPTVYRLEGMDARRRGFIWFPYSVGKSRREIDGCHVVNDMRILSEAGALWRLRWCAYSSCKRAYCANFPHQVFHSKDCKRAREQSTWKYKEKRKRKAADSYRRGLTPSAREKLDEKRARREERARSSARRDILDELREEARGRGRSKC